MTLINLTVDNLILNCSQDFPNGPMVKNLPSSIGNTGSIPGLGTKIPYVPEQLWSPSTTMREACILQQRACVLQLRECSQRENKIKNI